MNEQDMIDLLCMKWAITCCLIDGCFEKHKNESAFAEADHFAGWLSGFRDVCFEARLHEAAKIAHQAQQLFIYRKHQQLFRKWDSEAVVNG